MYVCILLCLVFKLNIFMALLWQDNCLKFDIFFYKPKDFYHADHLKDTYDL